MATRIIAPHRLELPMPLMAPRAFVLMPFAAEFDEIYNLFIADALTEAGFAVQRADDFRNQRNILQDVVAGIGRADLVVADLTGANPNVYYELGVAHALRRPVVLLTQAVDELPFDLRSYRVISYNTHFAAIRSAKQDLLAAAKGALDGSIAFSSPVADYLPVRFPGAGELVSGSEGGDDDDGEPGFLDYMVRLEEGFAALGAELTEISERTNEINAETNSLTERIPVAAADRAPGSAKRTRELVRDYSEALHRYARALGSSVAKYRARLKETEGSLEAIISAQAPTTDEDREELREVLAVLQGVEEQAFQSRTSFAGLASVMAQIPRIEARLDRSRKDAIAQLQSLVEAIDATIEMISRAQGIGARILRASEARDASSEPSAT